METILHNTTQLKRIFATSIPSLDEIVSYYSSQGLVAHEETILQMNPLIRQLSSSIPVIDVLQNVALLSVWPLVERSRLLSESITRDLNHDERDRLSSLSKKYQDLEGSQEFITTLDKGFNSETIKVKYLHPYATPKEQFVSPLLSIMCPPLQKHINITRLSKTKIFHDAQMGGSFYIMGEDKGVSRVSGAQYSFYQRSFLCKDKAGENVLLIDNIECGEPYFRTLNHWRGHDEMGNYTPSQNRIHHLHLSLASTMSIASSLGVKTIVPRDFELVELSRSLGLGEKTIFSKDQGHWKVGLHSERSHTGVYTHSLYRGSVRNGEGHQVRHPILTLPDFNNPHELLQRMTKLSADVLVSNYGRNKIAPRTREKVNTLLAYNALVQHYPLSTRSVQEQANHIMGVTNYTLKNINGVKL